MFRSHPKQWNGKIIPPLHMIPKQWSEIFIPFHYVPLRSTLFHQFKENLRG